MKKVFKFLLVIFVWFLILGICAASALLIGYPLEQGIKVFAAIFAVWYTIKLIIYLVKRWQAKQRVEKLVNVDKAAGQKVSFNFFQLFASRDFDKHLKKVIKTIKAKSQSTDGVDIQDLKWNLHIKLDNDSSNWLQRSDINRPKLNDPIFTEHPYIKWLPFNQYMMIDVDAYLVNAKHAAGQVQWLEFLDSLSFCEKRVPLDAITLSINVETLLDQGAALEAADKLRQCVEDVRDRCGVNVPVSVVLLGMESFAGMDSWLEACETDFTASILGVANKGQNAPQAAVADLFARLGTIFHQGALATLMDKGFIVDAVRLSRIVSELETASTSFIERAFSRNDFQAAPQLSGLYVVMAKQANYAFNQTLLESATLCPYRGVLTANRTEADKLKLKRLSVYYGATAVLSMLLISLYNTTSSGVQDAFYEFSINQSEQTGAIDVTANLQNRANLARSLDEVAIAHWLFSTDDPMRTRLLSERFNKDLNDLLITPIEQGFALKLSGAEEMSVDDKVDYLNIVMRRINIFTAILNDSSISFLAELPQPYDSAYITDVPDVVLTRLNALLIEQVDLGRRFNQQSFEKNIMQQRDEQRLNLASLISQSAGDMSWLVEWTNNNQTIKDIGLSDYWPVENQATGLRVSRAYTLEGRQIIENFIEQLIAALGGQNTYISNNLPAFRQQYEINYVAQWGAFLAGFNDGMDALVSRDDWLLVINNLPTGRNIYFTLMNDAWSQLEPFATSENQPDWHAFLIYYQDMLALSTDEIQGNAKKNKVLTKMALKVVGATGPVGKAIAGAGKSGLKTQKKLDKASGSGPGASERELNLQAAANELDAYKKTIADIIFSIERTKSSFENIQGLFMNPEGPEAASTKLGAAQRSVKNLEALIGKIGMSTNPFWQLYVGPVQLTQAFMLAESACHINKQWQDEFLYELNGVPDYKVSEFAYGDAGIVWSFTDSTLLPFLTKRAKGGFNIQRVNEQRIAFDSTFLEYLNRAKDQGDSIKFESFNLDITAFPTSVNKSALLFVSETELVMQCGEGQSSIVNNNFIVEDRLVWEPSCGSVTLRFTIGNRVIEKQYPGPNGVSAFLKAFEFGEHTFDIEEFPRDFYTLKQFEIQRIRVQFAIDGGTRLLQALDRVPPAPPQNIAQCWV